MRALRSLTSYARCEERGRPTWHVRCLTLTTTAARVGAVFLYGPSATSSTTATGSPARGQVATSGVVPSEGTVNGLTPAARRAPTARELAFARAESARRPLVGPTLVTAKVTQP